MVQTQKMKKYKLHTNVHLKTDQMVHATHPWGTDFTLCAINLFQDDELSTDTTNRINCPRCIHLIDYIKNFRESDLHRPKDKNEIIDRTNTR